MINKRKRIFLIQVCLIVCSLLVASPVIFAVITSTQTSAEVDSYPPRVTPGSAGLTRYAEVWRIGIGRMMLNSLYISAVVTVGKIGVSILAALALVYFNFRFKNLVFFFIFITIMFPVPVRVVPLFDLVQKLKMGDSYYALTIPFLASATATFLLRQHFMSIPSSMVDAARVEGAGPLKFLFLVLIPMSINTLGALAMVTFIYIWNQYLWPMIVISSNERQVVQLGLKMLRPGEAGRGDWALAMAGVVISMSIPLLMFLLLQEQFMKGFALSEEK